MHPSLNIALRAARAGAASLISGFDRLDRVKILQELDNDLLTSAHLDAEEAILQLLQKPFPRHGYRSTTERLQEPIESDTTWLLSPLIGTRNFLRGSHGFLLGIACMVEHKVTLAVLVDPLLDEEFSAVRGSGASLSGHRIRVSNKSALPDSVVAVEFPVSVTDRSGSSLPLLQQKLLEQSVDLRSTGNAILDMVYVAAGRFDGGLVARPSASLPLDTASMLLREAGGLVSDLSGNPGLEGDELVFGSPKYFKQLLQLAR